MHNVVFCTKSAFARIHGTDYYHLIPPISLKSQVGKDSRDTTLTADDASLNSMSIQSLVDLIGKIKSFVSDRALHPEGYNNNLNPLFDELRISQVRCLMTMLKVFVSQNLFYLPDNHPL